MSRAAVEADGHFGLMIRTLEFFYSRPKVVSELHSYVSTLFNTWLMVGAISAEGFGRLKHFECSCIREQTARMCQS